MYKNPSSSLKVLYKESMRLAADSRERAYKLSNGKLRTELGKFSTYRFEEVCSVQRQRELSMDLTVTYCLACG